MNQRKRRTHILLVEDNSDDVLLTKLAFEEINTNGNGGMKIYVAEDGEKALRFLRREGKYKQSPRPRIILLDLNLPKITGLEVLEQIKQDPHLKNIPVVILTTSTYEGDILQSYQRHANCYITKPMDLEAFMDVAKSLQHFWFSVVKLPQEQ
ncbi:MAG: response regulator [Candidatus Aminicenantes bacterium]|jgi:CheY-like chemotaxis protein